MAAACAPVLALAAAALALACAGDRPPPSAERSEPSLVHEASELPAVEVEIPGNLPGTGVRTQVLGRPRPAVEGDGGRLLVTDVGAASPVTCRFRGRRDAPFAAAALAEVVEGRRRLGDEGPYTEYRHAVETGASVVGRHPVLAIDLLAIGVDGTGFELHVRHASRDGLDVTCGQGAGGRGTLAPFVRRLLERLVMEPQPALPEFEMISAVLVDGVEKGVVRYAREPGPRGIVEKMAWSELEVGPEGRVRAIDMMEQRLAGEDGSVHAGHSSVLVGTRGHSLELSSTGDGRWRVVGRRHDGPVDVTFEADRIDSELDVHRRIQEAALAGRVGATVRARFWTPGPEDPAGLLEYSIDLQRGRDGELTSSWRPMNGGGASRYRLADDGLPVEVTLQRGGVAVQLRRASLIGALLRSPSPSDADPRW